jgi:hypothetical protein
MRFIERFRDGFAMGCGFVCALGLASLIIRALTS